MYLLIRECYVVSNQHFIRIDMAFVVIIISGYTSFVIKYVFHYGIKDKQYTS